MRRHVSPYSLISSHVFYENLDAFPADLSTLHERVRALLPATWLSRRSGPWFMWQPVGWEGLPQGWKIHVSTAYGQAGRTLDAVVPVCARFEVAFKHPLDHRVLSLMSGKNAPREQGGKFVTIYPRNKAQFLRLLDALAEATAGFSGPTILSDRRYGDSQVVQYRYGGIAPLSRADVTGRRVSFLVSPDGELVADQRLPQFTPPAWVNDPHPPAPEEDAAAGGAEPTLKNGRYVVQSALAFSNIGGVYKAVDTTTGQQVVIKEARPHFFSAAHGESVSCLKAEYESLCALREYGIAPQPIDLFQDWEHWFLVEELVTGIPLQQWIGLNEIGLKHRPSPQVVADFWRSYRLVFGALAEALATVHQCGYVFGDLSTKNVFIDEERVRVRFIDLESLFKADRRGTDIYTFGYAPFASQGVERATPARDCWGLGALMMGAVLPVVETLPANPDCLDAMLAAAADELSLPVDIVHVIRGLMARQPGERMMAAEAHQWIAGERPVATLQPPIRTTSPRSPAQLIEGGVRFILGAASYDRTDRLFPAHAELFETNPLSLAYGACGVAHVLRRVTGECPAPIVDWIRRRPVDPHRYGPGLYSGMAGIAWAFGELGLDEDAARLLRHAAHHPRLADSPTLFHGRAGVGLAALALYLRTRDRTLLDLSLQCGNALLANAERRDNGLCWRAHDGRVHYGLGHGAAGVALFFLYLSRATADGRWLEAGQQALDFELASAGRSDASPYMWSYAEAVPGARLPYFEYGSVGIAGVVLRYSVACSGYDDVLRELADDVTYKYAFTPGYFMGQAGIGQFFVDLALLRRDDAAWRQARRVADGIELTTVERAGGYAFLSEQYGRIACDFGTGTAGVVLFLHNLVARQTSSFMLDELLALEPAVSAPSPLDETADLVAV